MLRKECSELSDHWWKISCCETLTDRDVCAFPVTAEYFGRVKWLLCFSAACICITDICLIDVLSVLLLLEVRFTVLSCPGGRQNKSLAYCFPGDQLVQEGLVSCTSFVRWLQKKLSYNTRALSKQPMFMH